MKILISCATYSSGGAERVLSILSEYFADHYEEVIYLSWLDISDFYKIDTRVVRVCVERKCESQNLLRQICWFRSFIKKEKPDIVLSFLAPFNVVVCASLLGIKIPVIVCERNDPRYVWNGLLQRKIRKWAYRKAAGILEQTETNKSYFSGNLLNKTNVIYNPILMTDEYVGKALRTVKSNRIVSVVRLEKQKNIEMLLRAFKSFSVGNPDYSLTIYGNGSHKAQLLNIINILDLNEKVEMPGAIPYLWDSILDAKLFVLPSWYEGMPNALLEAMCLGLPCISTKVSGAIDLINDGENGILVDLDDDKAMSEAMNSVVSNFSLAESLGSKAKELYGLLNIESISKQWLHYIDNCIYGTE